MLSILYDFFQSILATALSNKDFHLYYTDEETEDNRRLGICPKYLNLKAELSSTIVQSR